MSFEVDRDKPRRKNEETSWVVRYLLFNFNP
jgi:hypothetical protein